MKIDYLTQAAAGGVSHPEPAAALLQQRVREGAFAPGMDIVARRRLGSLPPALQFFLCLAGRWRRVELAQPPRDRLVVLDDRHASSPPQTASLKAKPGAVPS